MLGRCVAHFGLPFFHRIQQPLTKRSSAAQGLLGNRKPEWFCYGVSAVTKPASFMWNATVCLPRAPPCNPDAKKLRDDSLKSAARGRRAGNAADSGDGIFSFNVPYIVPYIMHDDGSRLGSGMLGGGMSFPGMPDG